MARDLSRGWISPETRDAAERYILSEDYVGMRLLLDSLVLDGEPEIEEKHGWQQSKRRPEIRNAVVEARRVCSPWVPVDAAEEGS